MDWTRHVYFTWAGSDEMEEASGDGDAKFENDGTLIDKIRFHLGDNFSVRDCRWREPDRACVTLDW
jgi:hypothetical protein